MKPEQALEEARRRAAMQSGDEQIEGLTIEPTDRVGLEQLIEWAVAEPDPDKVRSTRALGAPITAIKRGMVHLTRQQTGDLSTTPCHCSSEKGSREACHRHR